MATVVEIVRRAAGLLLAVLVAFAALSDAGHAAPAPSPPTPLPPVQRRVALVVGNGAYQHLPRLANPPNDAALIAQTLKDLGFVLIGGAPQLNLDKPGFDRAVQNFGMELQRADVGLFFYAGHGLQVQGTNWLVPIGANPAGAQDLDFQMVDADLVLKQMQFAKTKLNVMILDACRNNPFSGRGLRATQGGLAEMRAPEGTLIAYATQPGSVAHDGDGRNSPFSSALATTLRQPGLDVFRLFNRVGLAVKRDTGGEQQPWVSSSPIDGDFYFSGIAPGDAPPPQVADPETVFWQSIAGSTNPADYDLYLRQFPDGRFATLARRRSLPAPEAAPPSLPGLQALLGPLVRPLQPPPPSRERAPSVFVASVLAVNVVSLYAEDAYRDYIRQFNPDRGPTGKESGASVSQIANNATRPALEVLKLALAQSSDGGAPRATFAEVYEAASVIRASKQARAPSAGSESLLPLARRYLESAEALIAVLEPARYYYDQQGYRDDHFAKGRAMHPGIIAAYREFLTTGEALRTLLRGQSTAERDAYLNGLAPDIRLAQVAVLRNVVQSRRLVQVIASNLDGGRDVRALDVTALKAEIDLVEQTLAQLQLLASSGPGFGDRALGPGGSGNIGRYIEYSAKFLGEAKYLWRAVRDRQPIDSDSFTYGTRYESDIINRFNDIVNMANPSR